MAYKKYIQRNGKLYGPYIYKSKRVDGKVVSEYCGSEEIKKEEGIKKSRVVGNNIDYKKILFIFIGILVLAFLVYFFAFSNKNIHSNKLTGGVILGFDTSYESGKPLEGILKFSLKEGELIPSSSKMVFENAGKTYEFPLSDILKETPLDGNYYIEGKEISGDGLGYGMEGERTVYPEVNFVLQIYNEENREETNNESISSEIVPIEVTPESTPEITTEITPEVIPESTPVEPTTEQSNPAPITGAAVKSSGGFLTSLFGLTGNVISMELKEEVKGVVSKDKPFVYDLKDGETAELVPKSVNINGEEVGDNIVLLDVKDNKATVTTDYSKKERGYGKEYIGEREKTISLDLYNLNLLLEAGDLNVKLIYGNEEILQISTSLKEGEKISEEVIEEPVVQPVEVPNEVNESNEILKENQTVQEIVNSSLWDIGDFLTAQERKILSDEFGNISLKSVKSEIFNGRIIRGYEFGGYNIEYSYDSSLNKDVLDVQMEKDRIKFLKDIASSISKKEASPKAIEGYNESYSL